MSGPRVSVLLPVLNPDVEFLRSAVESVRRQTYTSWELLLLEDPPHSAARKVLAIDDARIEWVARERRLTLADALNDGLARSRGEYVARLDSDDICMPDRLQRQVEYLDAHRDVEVVGSSLEVIDASGRMIGHRMLPASAPAVATAMRRFNAVAHPSVMFRREAVVSIGGYGATTIAEDYDLWCRIIQAGGRIENIPEPLLQYRFHAGALKFEGVSRMIRETIALKRCYFGNEFTARDRARIAGEYALSLLPGRVILRLFAAIEYGVLRP